MHLEVVRGYRVCVRRLIEKNGRPYSKVRVAFRNKLGLFADEHASAMPASDKVITTHIFLPSDAHDYVFPPLVSWTPTCVGRISHNAPCKWSIACAYLISVLKPRTPDYGACFVK